MVKTMTWKFLFSLACWLVLTAPTGLAAGPARRTLADATKAQGNQTTDDKAADSAAQSAAQQLVQQHLPELKPVLQRLRSSDPRQYQRAVNDLARSARKLETAKNRDERLYEIEVEALQARNAVNLLTAKLKVRDNQADRKSLRKAVERLQQSAIARVQYDVDTLQARMQGLQRQLQNAKQRLQSRTDEAANEADRNYVLSLRKAGRRPTTPTADRQPAEQRPKASDKTRPD